MPATVFTIGGNTMTGGSGTIPNGSASASATNLYEGAMLPAKTIRFRFSDLSYDPSVSFVAGEDESFVWTRVSSSPNVWDCHVTQSDWRGDTHWYHLFGGSAMPEDEPAHFSGYGLIIVGPGEYDYDPTKTITVVDANLTGVVDANSLFEECSQLVTVEKLRGTQDLADITNMFGTNSALTSVAVFDISGATSTSFMFAGTGIEHAPAFDTSHITDFSTMFNGCDNLRDAPLYDTSSATDLSYMFNNCESLSGVPLYNTSAAANVRGHVPPLL